ncbi:hypothetical protein FSW04_03350 [Baekduia soli]|uniref:Uncharacterized protein n=1 Tax=Baekduia soli TaxID=496014 RepID=A0A5B8U119_9ACTN|nr:hypothetical protein [Baekduia soli]QEC46713.1 hypothetical protein FSW04_03350 [Baekduia soli]
MLERVLRLAAIICSLLVAAGWVWFAANETNAASQDTQQEIAGRQAARVADPSPDQERARERVNGKVHEAIDDANDVLLKPFAFVARSSSSKWVRRTVPALLALLVYGFGLGLLARFAAGR